MITISSRKTENISMRHTDTDAILITIYSSCDCTQNNDNSFIVTLQLIESNTCKQNAIAAKTITWSVCLPLTVNSDQYFLQRMKNKRKGKSKQFQLNNFALIGKSADPNRNMRKRKRKWIEIVNLIPFESVSSNDRVSINTIHWAKRKTISRFLYIDGDVCAKQIVPHSPIW